MSAPEDRRGTSGPVPREGSGTGEACAVRRQVGARLRFLRSLSDFPPPPGRVPASRSGAGNSPDDSESLGAIREDLGDCTRCRLAGGRQTIVFGVGDPRADLMFIGEGPGREEDRQGEPFVGRAGQLLTAMIERVFRMRRGDVYIANIVKCRPPNNRNPLADEVAACLPFLKRQIASVRPRVICLLGGVALKSLFPKSRGITAARGRVLTFEGTPVVPTFHPAYLLRKGGKELRDLKWKVADDCKTAIGFLEEPEGASGFR